MLQHKCQKYVAVTNDCIDEALEEFITSSRTPGLSHMFKRECEGVYKFGDRRIIMNKQRGTKELVVLDYTKYIPLKLFVEKNQDNLES